MYVHKYGVCIEQRKLMYIDHQWRHAACILRGRGMPKFDTGTQAILKFDTSTHHYFKIDTRHAIEATHDTCLFYLRPTTPHPNDTKIDNVGYRFFRQAKLALESILNAFIRRVCSPPVATAEIVAPGERQVVLLTPWEMTSHRYRANLWCESGKPAFMTGDEQTYPPSLKSTPKQPWRENKAACVL